MIGISVLKKELKLIQTIKKELFYKSCQWHNAVTHFWKKLHNTEAVAQGCPVKKVFLEISQNS